MENDKVKDLEQENLEQDPIYKSISLIQSQIKVHVEKIAQEIWNEEKDDIITQIANILKITPDELNELFIKAPPKRGRPRKLRT